MNLLGLTVHDPDVALTDLALAILAGAFAWLLGRDGRPGVLLMAALASAAFWGAVYHGLFPGGQSTAAGYVVWRLVALSIVLLAAQLLFLSLPSRWPRAPVVILYVIAFAAVVLLGNASFRTIMLFYGPVVLLGLVASLRNEWRGVAAGLGVSIIAALLQATGVSLHPVYFDHNALYHVVQAAALLLLFLGLRSLPDEQPGR